MHSVESGFVIGPSNILFASLHEGVIGLIKCANNYVHLQASFSLFYQHLAGRNTLLLV